MVLTILLPRSNLASVATQMYNKEYVDSPTPRHSLRAKFSRAVRTPNAPPFFSRKAQQVSNKEIEAQISIAMNSQTHLYYYIM